MALLCSRSLFFRFSVLPKRSYSVNLQLRDVEDTNKSVAVLKLANPPVNGLDLPLVIDLSKQLEELNRSDSINGIIIASDIPKIFSAGLELNELYNSNTDRLKQLWTHLQDVWFNLYSSPHPVIAAINGHCLAGGTILAAASDYRIGATGKYKLGVTAAKIGVIAPPWFQKTLVQVIGHRHTELMLTQSKIFSPTDAMNIGLLDELYDGDDIVSYCVSSLKPFLEVYQPSRALMKLQLRDGLIKEFLLNRDQDMDDFLAFVLQTSVQEKLGEHIKNLKRKQ